MFKSTCYLVAYNHDSGKYQLLCLSKDADLILRVGYGVWDAKLTSFMVADLEGSPHCLTHSNLTDKFFLIKLDPKNMDNKDNIIVTGKWAGHWSNFMPWKSGNSSYYLAYSIFSGKVAFCEISLQGKTTKGVQNTLGKYYWKTGWSHFIPFTVNGTQHYLSYKCDPTTAEIIAKKIFLGTTKAETIETPPPVVVPEIHDSNPKSEKIDDENVVLINVTVGNQIASGNFGSIYQGEWISDQIILKKITKNSDELKKEVAVLKYN
jgi:hypothetical protein